MRPNRLEIAQVAAGRWRRAWTARLSPKMRPGEGAPWPRQPQSAPAGRPASSIAASKANMMWGRKPAAPAASFSGIPSASWRLVRRSG